MPKSSDSDNSAESTADIIGHLSEAISRVDPSRSIAQEEMLSDLLDREHCACWITGLDQSRN